MKLINPSPLAYGKQTLGDEEQRAVIDVLASDWISQGPKIDEFEVAFARYCGSKYAVAVCNGTAALHLACLAAGLKPGTEAITTPISFLATSNAVVMTGSKPVFADISYDTVNIDAEKIVKKISKKTRAVLPVHFAGLPVNLREIHALAKKNHLVVIEDGCHALGAEYAGRRIGACQYSDMTCFSFHPVKHITTGEGGMITTNQKHLYDRLRMLRTHGIVRSPSMQQAKGKWFMEMRDLGFNYRITDIQCAMGLVQLGKLDGFLERRREIAAAYDKGLKIVSEFVVLPQLHYPDRKHAWHLYLLRLKSPRFRRRVFDRLWEENIRCQVHYIPIPDQPFYRQFMGAKSQNYPNATRYYEETMSLPIYPLLTNADTARVVESVCRIVRDECGG